MTTSHRLRRHDARTARGGRIPAFAGTARADTLKVGSLTLRSCGSAYCGKLSRPLAGEADGAADRHRVPLVPRAEAADRAADRGRRGRARVPVDRHARGVPRDLRAAGAHARDAARGQPRDGWLGADRLQERAGPHRAHVGQRVRAAGGAVRGGTSSASSGAERRRCSRPPMRSTTWPRSSARCGWTRSISTATPTGRSSSRTSSRATRAVLNRVVLDSSYPQRDRSLVRILGDGLPRRAGTGLARFARAAGRVAGPRADGADHRRDQGRRRQRAAGCASTRARSRTSCRPRPRTRSRCASSTRRSPPRWPATTSRCCGSPARPGRGTSPPATPTTSRAARTWRSTAPTCRSSST